MGSSKEKCYFLCMSHRMVFLKHLSCFSVNNLQFSHFPVEYWDALCQEWYSIHIDGVDGVLTVQLAFRDYPNTFEILLLDLIFGRLVSCFAFVEAPRYRYCCSFSTLVSTSPVLSVMSVWWITLPRVIVILLHFFIPKDILMASLDVFVTLMRLRSWWGEQFEVIHEQKMWDYSSVDLVSYPCLFQQPRQR